MPLIRCSCHGQEAHQVQGQPVVGEDDDEEDEVHEEVQHVGDELQVEHVDALVLPATLHVVVDHRQAVLDEDGHHD